MSTPAHSAWEHVKLVGAIADLKEDHYQSLLTLCSMLELLVEKGLLTREEVADKAALLEHQLTTAISASLRPIR